MSSGVECTRGAEFMCAVSPQPYCTCQCKGKNHGKYPQLKALRDKEGPWSASEARRRLQEAQEKEQQELQRQWDEMAPSYMKVVR